AEIQSEAPRMHAPTRARQGPADVHGRSITSEETRKDERWRPILRAARAHRAKSREQAWDMPGNFTQSVPSRRSKIVRVNRAGRAGNRGSRPFHSRKMGPFR